MNTRKCKGVVLKLDFEKTFDTVNWDFLFQTLKLMNFGSKWIKWIHSVFNTIRISILVNGSLTSQFSPSRGLRQGDPFSPLLFNIVGQVLHHLLNTTKIQGKFKGLIIGEDNIEFSHQFADDTLLFIEGEDNSIHSIKRIITIFQFSSGLKIDFQKSELIGPNYTHVQLQNWATVLGCKIGSRPLKYLRSSFENFTTQQHSLGASDREI